MTSDPQLPLAAGAQGEGCIFIGTLLEKTLVGQSMNI